MSTVLTDQTILDVLDDLSLAELEDLYTYLADYEETPVDIQTFIEDPEFLGKYFDGRFNPYWMGVLKDIYPSSVYSPYFLINFRGCLGADTKIPLLNGTHERIEDIVKRFQNDKDMWVLSWNLLNKSFEPTKIINAFSTGIKKVYKIVLDNGESIECTSDHRFVSRDNKWVSIDKGIDIGTSLLPYKGSLGSMSRYHGKDSQVYLNKLNEIRQLDPNYNHSVVSVEYIGEKEVFDLTVDRNSNFCLSSGVIAHNSIGRGKSTAACTGICYDLYKLLCMITPQKSLGLIPTTKIVFAIFNVTMGLANDVIWDMLSQMFSASPYFTKMMQSMKNNRIRLDTLFPKRIDFFCGSRVGHTLGKAVFSAIISEANFEIVSDQIYKAFNSLLARMESRFLQPGGTLPGKIWVDSSEGDKLGAINKIIDAYKSKPGVFVNRGPLWQVWPDRYTMGWFKVYKGSEIKPPTIIEDNNEEHAILISSEPHNIIDVPLEHKDRFETDLHSSLRDLAGEPLSGNFKLFRLRDRLNNAVKFINIFTRSIISLDFDDDTDQLQNYLRIPGYFSNPLFPDMPRNIHIDIALSGDRLGIAASYVAGFREVESKDPITFNATYDSLPIINTDWCVGIEARPGQQIPLYKIRLFVLWLTEQGYPIGKITCDGFQCFTGDTKISLLNGREVPIKELEGMDEFWVYSCTPEGNVVPGRGHNCRKTGEKARILKVTLDNGQSVRCTFNHKFMLRDGSYKEAQYLTSEDSLMSLYRREQFGYEQFLNPNSDNWVYTHVGMAKKGAAGPGRIAQHLRNHRVVDVSFVGYEDVYDIEVDKYHNFALSAGVFVHNSADMIQGFKKFGFVSELLSVDRTSVPYFSFRNDLYHGLVQLVDNDVAIREAKDLEVIEGGKKVDHPDKSDENNTIPGSKDIIDAVCISGDTKLPLFDGSEVTIEDLYKYGIKDKYVYSCKKDGDVVPGKIINVIYKGIKEVIRVTLDNDKYLDCTPDHKFMLRDGSYKEAQYLTIEDSLMPFHKDISNNISYRYLDGYEVVYDNKKEIELFNHRIRGIERLGEINVYDISVEDYHNFAISSGIFIHNCGSYYRTKMDADSYRMYTLKQENTSNAGVPVQNMFWPNQ